MAYTPPTHIYRLCVPLRVLVGALGARARVLATILEIDFFAVVL